MNGIVVGFCGGISSGKTSLSTSVAEAMDCPRTAFGDYVRASARHQRLPETRESLQEIGARLVVEDTPGFCAAVLSQVSWEAAGKLIVDGVRHRAVLEALRSLVSPIPFKLVFVETTQEVRNSRLESRVESSTNLAQLERHSTEVEVVSSLRNEADLIVSGTELIPAVTAQIVAWLQRFMLPSPPTQPD